MFRAASALRASTSRHAARTLAPRSARLLATKPPPIPPLPKSSQPAPTNNVKKEPNPRHVPPPPTLSGLPSLDFDPAASKGGRTGARSAKDSPSTVEAKKKRMGRILMVTIAAGLVGGWVYAGRDWEEGERIPKVDGAIPGGRIRRANARIMDLFDTFNKPAWEELLPKPQHKPYTLLLSMDDLLITSTWDREHGWRTAKRPGVDYFIAYLSQFYEIVLFTTQHAYTANPVLEQLDPYNSYFAYRLFRESARTQGSKLVKDLTYLNRDLSKVILVDTHTEHAAAQPENSIVVSPWKGSARDTGLIALIPFLESVAIYQAPDVRPIIKQYEGQDIAKAYAAKEAEMKRRHVESWQKTHQGKHTAPGVVSKVTLSSLFGGGGGGIPGIPANDPTQPPLTYLEQKRLEAQDFYRREQQWFKDNEEEFKRIVEEDKQRQLAEMSGSIFGTMLGWGGPPTTTTGAPAPTSTSDANSNSAPKPIGTSGGTPEKQ